MSEEQARSLVDSLTEEECGLLYDFLIYLKSHPDIKAEEAFNMGLAK